MSKVRHDVLSKTLFLTGIDLVTMQNEITALKFRTEQLETALNSQVNKNKDLSRTLDDQVNRNLRKTLIFRGISGTSDESWSKTSDKLAKFLSDIDCNHLSVNEVLHDIDRAHRPNTNEVTPNANRNSPPPIFVQFNTWKSAQYYMKSVIDYNKNLRNREEATVFVDQMYSRDVTARRKSAIELRKELKKNGDKSKMFIKFPAILMKYDVNTKKYIEFKKF